MWEPRAPTYFHTHTHTHILCITSEISYQLSLFLHMNHWNEFIFNKFSYI